MNGSVMNMVCYEQICFEWSCCNLSDGVALIMWFTTNGMCVKNKTIIYVARASNSKRDCDVVALPILTCERLNMMTSVRDERLRAWSPLLLAATVRSFVHMPLGISDRNSLLWVACYERACFEWEPFWIIVIFLWVTSFKLFTVIGSSAKAPSYWKWWWQLHVLQQCWPQK